MLTQSQNREILSDFGEIWVWEEISGIVLKDLKRSLQQIALITTSEFNFWENQRFLVFHIAINLYLVNCLSISLKDIK